MTQKEIDTARKATEYSILLDRQKTLTFLIGYESINPKEIFDVIQIELNSTNEAIKSFPIPQQNTD